MESVEPVHCQNHLEQPAFSSSARDHLLSNALSSRVWVWLTKRSLLLGNVSHTDFETILALVLDLSLESPERVFLGVQHQDVPVSRTRSSRIAFVDG
jgi:hypothetical protein